MVDALNRNYVHIKNTENAFNCISILLSAAKTDQNGCEKELHPFLNHTSDALVAFHTHVQYD